MEDLEAPGQGQACTRPAGRPRPFSEGNQASFFSSLSIRLLDLTPCAGHTSGSGTQSTQGRRGSGLGADGRPTADVVDGQVGSPVETGDLRL